MKLAARVGKLEVKAGKGRMNCPSCCLELRINPPDPDPDKIPPEMLGRPRCEMCGEEALVTLDQLPEEEREARLLQYSFPPEAFYTDERAHALAFWFQLRPRQRRKRARRKAREQQQQNARGAKPPAPTPAQRRILALREEVKRWRERRQREMKEKHGDPFPEIFARLKEIFDTRKVEIEGGMKGIPYGCVREVMDLENDISGLLACLELEKIIWGGELPSTVAAVEGLRAKIAETIEAARVREREEAERRERERLEREERYQREREEREEERRRREEERERMGRAQSAQSHSFWDSSPPDGDASTPRRRFRTEAGSARVSATGAPLSPIYIPSKEEADAEGYMSVGVAPSAADPLASGDVKPMPPPDDGTDAYKLKLMHYKQTGVWLAFEWEKHRIP